MRAKSRNFESLVLENQEASAETDFTMMISVFESTWVRSFVPKLEFMLKEFPCEISSSAILNSRSDGLVHIISETGTEPKLFSLLAQKLFSLIYEGERRQRVAGPLRVSPLYSGARKLSAGTKTEDARFLTEQPEKRTEMKSSVCEKL